ncbi:hypothetical protein EDP2_2716 [Enterobacter cloacae S611]|uniref:Uncharacterized protein n=1 Tax=Enterobacter cloacae S611 TaxID=1399146 RepID=A0ABP2ZM89_ENTCL|nr:hypothetical protein EDP2_2716 [Enterobacter cloacae S611]
MVVRMFPGNTLSGPDIAEWRRLTSPARTLVLFPKLTFKGFYSPSDGFLIIFLKACRHIWLSWHMGLSKPQIST